MIIHVHHLCRTDEVAGGITQVINEYLAWEFPTTQHHRMPSRAGGGLADVRPFTRAWADIRSLSPGSVVVAHLSQGGSFLREGALLALAARRGLATVAQLHGSSFPAFATRHPRLARRVLSSAAVVLVLGSETADAVRAVDAQLPIVRLPNAVSPITAVAKEPLVLFAGAVVRRKGVDVLLEAWRRLDAPDWRLIIAGPAAEPELLEDPPNRVEFVGSLPRPQVQALLARASVAALPSRREAMPLFILEALSAGTAVVSTPVGAIPEVLDEIGELVPAGDADALTAALRRLIESPAHRDALAAAGIRRYAERYSPEVVIPELEAALIAAVDAPRRMSRRNARGDSAATKSRRASRP